MSLEDSQLLLFALLNGTVLFNALCLTCLLGGWRTWAERLLDGFLYYVALIVAGFLALHFLHRITLDGLCVLHAGSALVLGWLSWRRGWDIRSFFSLEPIRRLGWIGQVLICLFAAWFCAYVYYCRYLPPRGHDPLLYHLPMAVQWLKDHRLSMISNWFLSPNSVYAPINGEIFLAWLIAPLGNDVAVRFGQMPFLAASMLAMYCIWRRWNIPPSLAVGCAGLLLIFRPFLFEIVLPNNDLIWATWFLIFIHQWQRLNESFASWLGCGLALGLFVGTKIVGLVYLPACLMLVAATQFRLRHQQSILGASQCWACFLLAAVLLGGFTYARNWLLAGNPVYPAFVAIGRRTLFDGIFDSSALAAAHWNGKAAIGFLFAPKATFGMPLLTGWIWALGVVGSLIAWCLRPALRSENREFALLWMSALLGYILFFWKVPYLDQRLIFPTYLAGLLCGGLLLQSLRSGRTEWPPTLGAIGVAACFGWESIQIHTILILTVIIFACLLVWLRLDLLTGRFRRWFLIATALGVSLALSIFWTPYVRTYQAVKFQFYPPVWPREGPAWLWLQQHTKDSGALVAYSGTGMLYPLFGQDLQNALVYLPIGPTGQNFPHELHCPSAMKFGSDGEFASWVAHAARSQPEEEAWLNRIEAAHPRFFFLSRNAEPLPVETRWVETRPNLFRTVFENGSVTIYELTPRKPMN